MSRLVKPKYAHHFLLDQDTAIMLAEQTGIEGRTKTEIVTDAITQYCYKFKADKLREEPGDGR